MAELEREYPKFRNDRKGVVASLKFGKLSLINDLESEDDYLFEIAGQVLSAMDYQGKSNEVKKRPCYRHVINECEEFKRGGCEKLDHSFAVLKQEATELVKRLVVKFKISLASLNLVVEATNSMEGLSQDESQV